MASTALTTLQNTKDVAAANAKDMAQRVERKVAAAVPTTPLLRSKKVATTSTPRSESPGQWRHPELAELARRQKKNTFDSSNVWTILANAIVILMTWQWREAFSPILPSITSWEYWTHIEWVLTLVYFYNIYHAARPAWRIPDNIPDVDLTAGQRALLGLDPNATPPETAGTRYLTPPKYARSAGGTPSTGSTAASSLSRAASFGSSVRSMPSPGSATRSVSGSSLLMARDVPGSGGGNLWQRKVGADAVRRRSSLGGGRASPSPHVPTYGDRDAWMLQAGGTPPRREEWRFVSSGGAAGSSTVAAGTSGRNSPLGMSLEGTGLWGASTSSSTGLGGSVFRPDTPSPVGRGAGVPLTSRWVYERGREEGRF